MPVYGPKRLKKRADFVGKVLGLKDFRLYIDWTKSTQYSECEHTPEGNFIILIQDFLDSSELIKTIGHEMVHISQFLNGDLRNGKKEGTALWKGKKYKNIYEEENYLLSPWELEARSYEEYIEWKWRNRK